jgi:hypothetical protein
VTSDVAIDFQAMNRPAFVDAAPGHARNGRAGRRQAPSSPGTTPWGLVEVFHLAATPIGMSVVFRAEVTGVNERRVSFKVWAEDETEKIAEGTTSGQRSVSARRCRQRERGATVMNRRKALRQIGSAAALFDAQQSAAGDKAPLPDAFSERDPERYWGSFANSNLLPGWRVSQ